MKEMPEVQEKSGSVAGAEEEEDTLTYKKVSSSRALIFALAVSVLIVLYSSTSGNTFLTDPPPPPVPLSTYLQGVPSLGYYKYLETTHQILSRALCCISM